MPPPEQRRAFPDRAHEDLAQWVEEAIADVRTNRDDIGDSFMLVDTLFALSDSARAAAETAGADMGDSLLLVDALFSLLDSALNLIDAQRIRIDALNIRADTAIDGMDALQARVGELERRLDALDLADDVLPGPDAG